MAVFVLLGTMFPDTVRGRPWQWQDAVDRGCRQWPKLLWGFFLTFVDLVLFVLLAALVVVLVVGSETVGTWPDNIDEWWAYGVFIEPPMVVLADVLFATVLTRTLLLDETRWPAEQTGLDRNSSSN